MRRPFVLILIFFSTIIAAQGIVAPSSRTIEANASNVDAGDFVVTWPNNTEDLLLSLSLEYHNGSSISFPVTTGITRMYGFNTWSSVTSIVFYGKRDNVNAALAAMTLSMGSSKTAVKINVEVSNFDSSYTYNPVNQHFYRYITGVVSYATAKANAATYSFKGKTGYLVTITSQSEQDFLNNNIVGNNIWFALTDEGSEGNWRIDAGPESGTLIKTQNGQTAGNIAGFFNNWCTGEPNDANNEDYAVTKWGGGTCWNDVSSTNSSVVGYIVEISEDFPAGSDYTGVYSSYTVHNNEMAFSLTTSNSINTSSVSNLTNLFGGIQMNNGHTITVPTSTVINSNKISLDGTGKMIFTDATSKWMPGVSSTEKTFIHSPSTNTNPTYWSVSSTWSGDGFYPNAPYPTTTNGYHFTPWLNSPQGWSAGVNDTNQYIILNYDIPVYITGIITQGRSNNGGQWVKTANIDVSMDGITWTRVLTNANLNTNSTDAVTTLFPGVQYAKYAKIMPTDWFGHITMRLGLLIKSANIIPDGLVLNLDAGNQNSYKGTGTTWNDLSGNVYHGTLTNTPIYNLQNKGYFSFDGVSTYCNGVNIPSTSGTNSRTVMAWYKSTANRNTAILDKGSVNVDGAEQLFIAYANGVGASGAYPPTNPGGVCVVFWGNDLYYPINSSTLFDGNWHFVAYTYDNTNSSVQICFDGVFASSIYYWNNSWTTLNSKPFPLARAINTQNNPYLVGQNRGALWGNGGLYSNTSIPLVQIYNRALSEQEIIFNYNSLKSRYGK